MTRAETAKKGDDAGILLTWRQSPLAAKALLAGIFVNRLGGFVQIYLVLFLTSIGFSTVQAGVALGTYSAGAVVGVIIGGSLTDKLGARRTIVLSMSGTAVLLLAIFYLRYFPALAATVAVVGAVTGAYRPAAKTLLSELTPKHRQVMIFAMYRLAYNLGTTAAPLIGAGLLAISYQFLFWGEAVAALAYAAIAAIALPRHRVSAADEPAGAATDQASPSQAAIDQATTDQSDPESATSGRGGYLAMLADRKFVLFLLASLINAVVYVQYLSTLPVAMNAAGLGATWFGTMVAINGFIVITCELLVTKVVQRIPMRPVVMVGFLLLGGGLACYALPFGVPVFVIGTLVWSLAEIVAGPTMFAYPAVAGPERLRGRYIGAASATFGIGAAIGPALGLWVWNVAGIGVWWWCGLACLIGVATAWIGMRPTPAAQTTAPAETTAPPGTTASAELTAPAESTAPGQQQEPPQPRQPVEPQEPVRPQEATTR